MGIDRRDFLKLVGQSSLLLTSGKIRAAQGQTNEDKISEFCKRLVPVGRILEYKNWSVWGCSPIRDENGKVHVFFARWPAKTHPGGWLTHSEIAHAIADNPAGPYRVLGAVLKGRGNGHWDAVTVHNPTIHKVGNQFALFYMGNSDGTVDTQRVGLALSKSLHGPWERVGDKPVIDVSDDNSQWDGYITTNPALLQHPSGEFWLYYKAWDRSDDLRKLGLAVARSIAGPYNKHPENPIVDFSDRTPQVTRAVKGNQVEDPYVFMENGKYHILLKDFGMIDHRSGLYMSSEDGIHWDHDHPQVGYRRNSHYFDERTHRFERPQILFRDNNPEYLFLGLRGGRGPGSGAVLRIRPAKNVRRSGSK